MKYKNAHSSKTTGANELTISMLLLQGKSGFLGKIWIIFDNFRILINITCWPIGGGGSKTHVLGSYHDNNQKVVHIYNTQLCQNYFTINK